MVRGRGDALVEHHHDVAADGALHRDAGLGRKVVEFAVDVTAECRALLGHLAVAGKGEDLEAARVGEDGAIPAHEAVDAAEFPKHLGAGAEQQMVGVGEQALGAEDAETVGGHVLHRRLRADRHEYRRAHLAVCGEESSGAGARAGCGFFEGEGETGHAWTGEAARADPVGAKAKDGAVGGVARPRRRGQRQRTVAPRWPPSGRGTVRSSRIWPSGAVSLIATESAVWRVSAT